MEEENRTEVENQAKSLRKRAAREIGFSAVKAQLDKQKKVSVRLPKPKDDKDINYVPVCINGYIYQVKKGESVSVPETVAELLEAAGYLDN